MTVERPDIDTLRETPTPSIICPDYQFDDTDLQGAALIILKSNAGNPQILLALHNSEDSEKHYKWSFIVGRRKSGEETGLTTLRREVDEELNLDLNGLQVGTYDPDKILHISKEVPRRSQYYHGEKKFTVGVFTTWTYEHYPRRFGTHEIIKTKFFPLEDVLRGTSGLDLRDYTLPILNELSYLDFLRPPAPQLRVPLRNIQFPV